MSQQFPPGKLPGKCAFSGASQFEGFPMIPTAYPAADVLIHPDPHGQAEPHGNRYFRSEDSDAEALIDAEPDTKASQKAGD